MLPTALRGLALKIRTLEIITCTIIILKWNRLYYSAVMHPKDADGVANNEDPDQTAPLGAV